MTSKQNLTRGDGQPVEATTRTLVSRLRPFGEPSTPRSLRQLAITATAFVLLWITMWLTLDLGYWLTLLLALPAAGFLVRLFMIQHDCGHGSYFRSRRLNDLVGRVLGVVTMTPYDYWRSLHAVHHATSGNLDRRGIGDITMLTVGEYQALSWPRRLLYRLYRHPLVLFGVGPLYLFVFKHRAPFDLPLSNRGLWLSVLATNLAIVGLTAGAMGLFGPLAVLEIQLPVTAMAATIGVWLFFVQHQFEHAYWREDEGWDYAEAAVHGSSYYRLPRLLQWFTASIGLHHVHHLWSRIPNYRLQECVDQVPELARVRALTMTDSLRCARLALFDEREGRMISFRALRRRG